MYYLLVFQQLIASSTHLFAKVVTTTMHPTVVVLYRGMFSIIAYGIWLFIRRNKIERIEKQDWLMLLLLGLLNMPMNQLMFVWGLKYTSAPNASLAYALSPAFVLIISSVMHGERLSVYKVVGISVAIIGTVVVLFERGFSFSGENMFGNVIELCASLTWAFYTVLGRRIALRYGAVYSTAISMLIGFALYVPLFFTLTNTTLPEVNGSPLFINGEQWFGLFYLGVITSGLGFALWYVLLTKLESSKVAVFNNLQPVLTTILAVIFLHQQPSLLFVIGGVVALVGVVITQRG
ncbi:MAG: DMT family transporter [Bacteriodetes bacterium]|nr:DMT family transporter [Bacteroidota bacterium]